MKQYIGTLVKFMNTSNMSEVQGTLEDITDQDYIISDSIIVVNRAIADLATTMNEIIQYKYTGDALGSTIASPLGPLFDNSEYGSAVWLNKSSYVFVPLINIDIIKKKEKDLTENEATALQLVNAMTDYIDRVKGQYKEINEFFNTQEEAKE